MQRHKSCHRVMGIGYAKAACVAILPENMLKTGRYWRLVGICDGFGLVFNIAIDYTLRIYSEQLFMTLFFRYIRSFIFIVQMYVMMAIMALLCLVPMVLSPRYAAYSARLYCRWVFFSARVLVGLKIDVRGVIPTDTVLVAAKHQSFLDILIILAYLPNARFIMKKELLYTPFLGQYAQRIGCIAVNRGKGAKAMRHMIEASKTSSRAQGQLCIYPQGTRVVPGDKRPYKIGAGILYEQLQYDCVPVAVNVGFFWPRRGILRRSGTAVVEFLPRIEKGQKMAVFMKTLEQVIETRSDALLQEARAGNVDIEPVKKVAGDG